MSTPYPLTDAAVNAFFKLPGISSSVANAPLTHDGIMTRLSLVGNNTADVLTANANLMTGVISGRGVPVDTDENVNAVEYLQATGFDISSYSDASPWLLDRDIRMHLRRMGLRLAAHFNFQALGDGGPAQTTVDLQGFRQELPSEVRRRLSQLAPQDGATYSDDPTGVLHDHYREILRIQDPAELMMPILARALSYVEGRTRMLAATAMRINMISRGMDVGPIRIRPEVRNEILTETVEIRLADGSDDALVSVHWLITQLNDFMRSTKPTERGVRSGGARLRNLLNPYHWAIRHPQFANELVAGALNIFGPAIFEPRRRTEMTQAFSTIWGKFLGDGNAAFRRVLLENGYRSNTNPQFIPDVTDPKFQNAWQRTLETPSGGKIRYADVLRTLIMFMSARNNSRYTNECGGLSRQLGIVPIFNDPFRAVKQLFAKWASHPSPPCILFANHGAFPDIPFLAEPMHYLYFAARSTLLKGTPGINSYLTDGSHVNIDRNSSSLPKNIRRRNVGNALKAYAAQVWPHAPLGVFPQRTRSRRAYWADKDKDGDRGLAEDYARSAFTILSAARAYVQDAGINTPIYLLLVHIRGSKETLMTKRVGLGDMMGLRGGLRLAANFIKGDAPTYDPLAAMGVTLNYHPLIEIQPDAADDQLKAIIQQAIQFHDRIESGENVTPDWV